MKTIERKQDTRYKIKLGGLVKKSGLDQLPTAVFYGLLLESAEKLAGDQSEKCLHDWKIKGDLALTFEE